MLLIAILNFYDNMYIKIGTCHISIQKNNFGHTVCWSPDLTGRALWDEQQPCLRPVEAGSWPSSSSSPTSSRVALFIAHLQLLQSSRVGRKPPSTSISSSPIAFIRQNERRESFQIKREPTFLTSSFSLATLLYDVFINTPIAECQDEHWSDVKWPDPGRQALLGRSGVGQGRVQGHHRGVDRAQEEALGL